MRILKDALLFIVAHAALVGYFLAWAHVHEKTDYPSWPFGLVFLVWLFWNFDPKTHNSWRGF